MASSAGTAVEKRAFVLDADSHVLEPPDLWERYLERKFRDRAIRVVRSAEGVEQLLMDNETLLPGGLPVSGASNSTGDGCSIPGQA